MPRARRQAKQRADRPLTFQQKLDLRSGARWWRLPGSDRSPWASEDERRAAWEAHRDEMLAWPRVTHKRPAAYWQYTEGVPDELREPAWCATIPADWEARDAARMALAEARWSWLEASGLLVENEAAAIAEERARRHMTV